MTFQDSDDEKTVTIITPVLRVAETENTPSQAGFARIAAES
jgi:hypothetical protein